MLEFVFIILIIDVCMLYTQHLQEDINACAIKITTGQIYSQYTMRDVEEEFALFQSKTKTLFTRRKSNPYYQKRASISGQRHRMNSASVAIENIVDYVSRLSSNVLKFVSNPIYQPSPAEINVQTRMIIKDYIYRKLERKQCITFKVRLKPSDDELSNFVVTAGETLEKHYPHVYSDVSRKMATTMSSPEVVKMTLTTILEAIFRCDINWGKLLSLLAITSSFALECVLQGHAEYVDSLVECVVYFVSYNVNEWLQLQGGWMGFKLEYEKKRRWSTELIHLGGAAFILLFFITLIVTVVLIKK